MSFGLVLRNDRNNDHNIYYIDDGEVKTHELNKYDGDYVLVYFKKFLESTLVDDDVTYYYVDRFNDNRFISWVKGHEMNAILKLFLTENKLKFKKISSSLIEIGNSTTLHKDVLDYMMNNI